MITVQTGYGDNIREWSLGDMNLDNATVAARNIIAHEIATKSDDVSEQIKQAYWNAQEFEQAYYQFDWQVVKTEHEYSFSDLLEIAWEEMK